MHSNKPAPFFGSQMFSLREQCRHSFHSRIRVEAFKVLQKLTWGCLRLVDMEECFVFGSEESPLSVQVTVHDAGAYTALLFGGSLGVGESYRKGLWTCNDLPGLVRIFVRNLGVLQEMDTGFARLASRVHAWSTSATRRNTRRGSRLNIASHYDLPKELFDLFLDESKTYSSAIFPHSEATLEEAQAYKLERICHRLQLRPTDHLLEIGTGWGALALHAARVYGCRVTTTTISQEQHRVATERVRGAGLEDRVEVLLCDYRDIQGCYDKLVSVEMIEAVGDAYLPDYFRVCSARLVPEGQMLLQAITLSDQHYAQHVRGVDFIKKYIFPGSCIPSLTAILDTTTRTTDLRLATLEDLTPHYARTLNLWRERFLSHVNEVRALGFDDMFVRMWDYYLAYCEGGFLERYLGCVHMLFTKPACRALWTMEFG